MSGARVCSLLMASAIAVTACAPAARPGEIGPQPQPQPARTLNILIRAEPVSLAAKPLQATGVSIDAATRPFNAQLDIEDSRENVRPYLAEALPQLNTDTWRVLPDGRMETSYRLKPNLVWHDGAPLSAADFVFAWQVYSTPELGVSTSRPLNAMEEVVASDAHSLLIRWRRPYPDAGALSDRFQALPRHLLEAPYQAGQPDAFIRHPFWSIEYVGLGPYRLERWEPGAFIEGTAFEGHVWGRPKIQRLVVRFTSDENTALANLLAESVHLATDRSIRFEQAQVLNKEWTASNKGIVLLTPTMGRYMHIQFRPEYVSPRALGDFRVRKALAHSIDRGALNDGLFGGQGVMADNLIRRSVPYHGDIERAVAKYPYDVRRTEQLLSEAGFSRGGDGVYLTQAGERFAPQLMNQAGVQPERETAIMVETWQRAAIDARPYIVPVARSRDDQERATFPALQTASGQGVWEERMQFLITSEIGSPPNRWRGQNRGGWSHPEYDRLWEAYSTILDPSERQRQIVQMEKLVSEQLPVVPLFFNFGVSAYLGVLRGPDAAASDDTSISWNIHEWELRS